MVEKTAPHVERDPIYNDPPGVKIGTLRVVPRELKAADLRRHVRAIFAAFSDIQARHPELKDLGENPGAAIIAAILGDIGDLMETATELVSELIEASTGIKQPAQDELPASAYFDLIGVVLDAQKPGLDAFFRLQGKLSGLAGQALPGTDGSARQ